MATNFTSKNISSIKISNVKYNLKSIPFHASQAEWEHAALEGYVPKQGELIVYDIDEDYNYERFKIGDGVTVVGNLPFYFEEEISAIKAELKNKVEVSFDSSNKTLIFST